MGNKKVEVRLQNGTKDTIEDISEIETGTVGELLLHSGEDVVAAYHAGHWLSVKYADA